MVGAAGALRQGMRLFGPDEQTSFPDGGDSVGAPAGRNLPSRGFESRWGYHARNPWSWR